MNRPKVNRIVGKFVIGWLLLMALVCLYAYWTRGQNESLIAGFGMIGCAGMFLMDYRRQVSL